MDLINREDVIKLIHKKIENTSDFLQHDVLIDLECEVEEIPTIDAVPVVWCKDCRYWGIGISVETDHVKCCEYAKYMVGENGYCVYGDDSIADMRKGGAE